MHQVHSNKFSFIDKKYKFNKKKIKGDALITNLKNTAIGVLTADCVPILIYDQKLKIISAIHAGWKGAYKDIINKVIKFFLKKGSQTKNLYAVIGPCITQKNYEVQKDFVDRFPEILEKFQGDLSTINNTDLAMVEAAIYIQNPRTTLSIAYVVGSVWSFLSSANVSTQLVDNRRWKKDVLGKGNAKKTDIKKYAVEKWGDIFTEQDFADAACIALWGKRSLDVIKEA